MKVGRLMGPGMVSRSAQAKKYLFKFESSILESTSSITSEALLGDWIVATERMKKWDDADCIKRVLRRAALSLISRPACSYP